MNQLGLALTEERCLSQLESVSEEIVTALLEYIRLSILTFINKFLPEDDGVHTNKLNHRLYIYVGNI